MKVRTRFAPSPTGFLHIGGLRTALFAFLWARKNKGEFILRVEDTDQARTVAGSLENIVRTLSDFSISPDEGFYWDAEMKERGDKGPYLQSKRLDIYKKYAEELVAKKHAYYCFCLPERLDKLREEQQAQKIPPKYDKQCLNLSAEEVSKRIASGEKHVIRLNVPANETITFKDLIHGQISISSNDVDDQVLLKSDGFPTYHLAVVVDDHFMEISHVIRGDEWIPSTPKHILIYKSFGWTTPEFVHLPLLLSKTKKKLSKREGDVAVKDFVEKGYLPEALLNFVAFLGWNPKTEQEIFSLAELIQEFSFEKVNKAGAVFDLDKLDWLNSLYIRKLILPDLVEKTTPYLVLEGIVLNNFPKEFVEKVLFLEQSRLKKLSEIGERVKYFFTEPQYDPTLLVWKKSEKVVIQSSLQRTLEFLEKLPVEKFNLKEIEEELKQFIQSNDLKTGEVLWPLRVSLSGLEASPSPFELIDAFSALPNGKEIVIKRVTKAVQSLL